MKKLSLILALALLLASSAFAERKITLHNGEKVDLDNAKSKGKKITKDECFKYEIKDNDSLYYNNNFSDVDMLFLLMSCQGEVKGYDKAKQRQEKRQKERYNKPDTTIKK